MSGICLKIRETEVRIDTISRMVREKVATNDVRNFVRKQSNMKVTSKGMNLKVAKSAMKSKLNDLCATANRLRRKKREIREVLKRDFNYSEARCRYLIKSVMNDSSNQIVDFKEKMNRKFNNCKMKTEKDVRESLLNDIPEDIWELASGVNIFNRALSPEERADPMICDNSIKLSKNELAFLRLGPRYMLRQTLDELEFKTDLNKMIVKERFEDREAEINDGEETTNTTGSFSSSSQADHRQRRETGDTQNKDPDTSLEKRV